MTTGKSVSSLALLLALPFAISGRSSAQGVDLQPFDDVVKASMVDLDLAVPESPAFTALGLSPENITRPASPREFATAVLTGLDRNGNFQAGLALDTVPYLLIAGNSLSIADYRVDAKGFNWKRQLSRTQLSLATTKGTNKDDKSVRLGLGLRMTPWTRGDPRMDDSLIGCLRSAATLPDPTGPGGTGIEEITEDTDFGEGPPAAGDGPEAAVAAYGKLLDAWEPKALAASEACLGPAEKRLNKASGWDIGLAPTWIQEGGSRSNITWNGATFWSSFAWNFAETLPLEKQATSRRPQLIAHARFRLDETAADSSASDGFLEKDTLVVGGRLRWGSPGLSFSFEGSYLYENPRGRSTNNSFVGGINSDIRIYEQFWVQVALGGTVGGSDDRIQVGATFKWGGRSMDLSQIVSTVRQTAQ